MRGLCEDTAELGFPSVSGLTGEAMPALGFGFHDRHAGAVHLDVEDRDRLAQDDGQVQLHGGVYLTLLFSGDIGPDIFGGSLHRLGGEVESSQQVHLLASIVERRLLADQRQHAPHGGGKIGAGDIQVDVGRKLSPITVIAKIVGAGDQYRTQCGKNVS